MTRKKVKLAFIMNDSTRKATYKKRKNGLLKKVSELSTLCGIHACAIIYSPYDSQPEVWPNTFGVQHVISEFKMLPEMERNKKMLDQETYLRQRIAKVHEQYKKQRFEYREKEISELMFHCLLTGKSALQNLTLPDLNDLRWKIENKLSEINKMTGDITNMAALQQAAELLSSPSPPPPPPPLQPPMPAVTHQIQPSGMQVQEQDHVPEWFGDWINHPNENMGFGHNGEDQSIMPVNNNPITSWPYAL